MRSTKPCSLGHGVRGGRAGAGKPISRLNPAAPLAVLALPALLSAAAGCRSGALTLPTADYVAADRATFDAVAPEYSAYVHNDPTLDDEQRTRRDRTVATWKRRIEAAGGSSGPAAQESSNSQQSSKQTKSPRGQEESEEDDADVSRF